MPNVRGASFRVWLDVATIGTFEINNVSLKNATAAPNSVPIMDVDLAVGKTVTQLQQSLQVLAKQAKQLATTAPTAKVFCEVTKPTGVDEIPNLQEGRYLIFAGDIVDPSFSQTRSFGEGGRVSYRVRIAHYLRRLDIGDTSSYPFYGYSINQRLKSAGQVEEQKNQFLKDVTYTPGADYFTSFIKELLDARANPERAAAGTTDPSSTNLVDGTKAPPVFDSLLKINQTDPDRLAAINYVQPALAAISRNSDFKLDKMIKDVADEHTRFMKSFLQLSIGRTTTYSEILWNGLMSVRGWVIPTAAGATVRPVPTTVPAAQRVVLTPDDYTSIEGGVFEGATTDRFVGGGVIVPINPIVKGAAPQADIAAVYELPTVARRGGLVETIQLPNWLRFFYDSETAPRGNKIPSQTALADRSSTAPQTTQQRRKNPNIPDYLSYEVVGRRLRSSSFFLKLPLRFDIGVGTPLQVTMPNQLDGQVGTTYCGVVDTFSLSLNAATGTASVTLRVSRAEEISLYDDGTLQEDGAHPFSSSSLAGTAWSTLDEDVATAANPTQEMVDAARAEELEGTIEEAFSAYQGATNDLGQGTASGIRRAGVNFERARDLLTSEGGTDYDLVDEYVALDPSNERVKNMAQQLKRYNSASASVAKRRLDRGNISRSL